MLLTGHPGVTTGEAKASAVPPKLEKKRNKRLRSATRAAARIFDDLARGKPLILKGTKVENRVRLLIDNMAARQLNPEDPQAYYDDTLSSPRKPKPVERIIGQITLSETLIHSRSKIEKTLGTSGSRAVHVLGAGVGTEETKPDAFRHSGLAIAVPGGNETARQLLHYAMLRQRGEILPPIIIENPGNFWDPLFKITGLMNDGGRFSIANREQAATYGIHITKNRLETLAIAKQIVADQAIAPQNYAPAERLLEDGTVLFVPSGTAKKCRQLQAAARAHGFDIQVRPIDQLVDFFLSPDETGNSYQENARLKALAGGAAWDRMPVAAQDAALERLGLERKQCRILAEDSGGWFKEAGLQHEPEFDGIRHLMLKNSRFPGVETGPSIWGGGGVPDFITKSRQAIIRKAALRGEAPNFGFGNISLLAMAPLEPDAHGKRPITITFAVRDMTIAPRPEPIDPNRLQNYDLSDFIYPRNSRVSERNSPKWINHAGPRSGALRAMAIAGGAKESGVVAKAKPVEDFRAAIFVQEYDTKLVWQDFCATSRQLTNNVKPYPAMGTLTDVQQRMFAPYDAVTMTFDTPKDPGTYNERFIQYGYIFFSALVAQQTRDKFMLGKMFAVLDSQKQAGDDRILDRLMAITYDLHRLGAIPQEPTTLVSRFTGVTELAKAFGASKQEIFRYSPFSYADGHLLLPASAVKGMDTVFGRSPIPTGSLSDFDRLRFSAPEGGVLKLPDEGIKIKFHGADDGLAAQHSLGAPQFHYDAQNPILQQSGTPSTKGHHTAVLLTASLKSNAVLETARSFTEALCDIDSGVVSGAGLNNGGMGVVTHTVHDLLSRGHKAHHTGVTTPHIRDFEASGNIAKMVGHFVLTRDIYSRMGILVSADTKALLMGGAGSIQELFADLMMKLAARKSDAPELAPFRRDETLVLNTPISDNGRVRGFYDATLQQIPPQILTDYRIHTPTRVSAAQTIVADQQRRMKLEGRKSDFTTAYVG